jgi:uncharacterized membrane protein
LPLSGILTAHAHAPKAWPLTLPLSGILTAHDQAWPLTLPLSGILRGHASFRAAPRRAATRRDAATP